MIAINVKNCYPVKLIINFIFNKTCRGNRERIKYTDQTIKHLQKTELEFPLHMDVYKIYSFKCGCLYLSSVTDQWLGCVLVVIKIIR